MQPAGEVEVIGGVLFVSWHGRVMSSDETGVLSKRVCEQYPDLRRVIISLEHVELRPADIPGLIVQYLSAYAAGYNIRFCSASPRVREVLESTRVIEVFQFPLDLDKEESLAAFHSTYAIPGDTRAHATVF